jgi:hypothetical protein
MRKGKGALPLQTPYTILEGFINFLFNYNAKKSRNSENGFTQNTAESYFSQAKQVFVDNYGELDGWEKKCQKIRRGLVSKFSERATKLGIASNQAPPATINDLIFLTRMLYAKGDAESIQFRALLVLQWQMLGRSIDCYWIQKRQVLVMPGGDIFISFSRLKTSTSQGISIYPSKDNWELCPVLALAVSFITASISSRLYLITSN